MNCKCGMEWKEQYNDKCPRCGASAASDGYPSRWPKSPRQRYMVDATFKAMVDMMTAHMMNCDYTPSEMREAALLASIRYYEMRPQGLVVRADQLHELMCKLEEG